MRIVINAAGVRELIKIYPENTVELAKAASQQVANAIINRTCASKIEAAVAQHLRCLGQSVISTRVQQLIKQSVEEAIDNELSMRNTVEHIEAINTLLQGLIKKQEDILIKSLDAKLDDLILKTFTQWMAQGR